MAGSRQRQVSARRETCDFRWNPRPLYAINSYFPQKYETVGLFTEGAITLNSNGLLRRFKPSEFTLITYFQFLSYLQFNWSRTPIRWNG